MVRKAEGKAPRPLPSEERPAGGGLVEERVEVGPGEEGRRVEVEGGGLESAGAGAAEDLPAPFPAEFGDEDRRRFDRALEALLFAATEPLTAVRLAEALAVSVGCVKEGLLRLAATLDREERPYELREHGGAWRLYARAEFYPYLLRLGRLRRVERLSPAALETLAVVAYRQPVTRAEIEAIRGVKVGPLLRALLDRKLIQIVGRAEVPGRPFQYGTTRAFLERFGLRSLADLPSLKEFQQGRI